MKALFSKKSIITLSILLVIDIIMIGCWTLYSQPDESMTIILLFIIPIVILSSGWLYSVQHPTIIISIINSIDNVLIFFLENNVFIIYVLFNMKQTFHLQFDNVPLEDYLFDHKNP